MHTKRELEELEEIAARTIPQTPGFNEAYELARRVSGGGKVYVIGGMIYRNIISNLYGKESRIKDFDFLAVNPLQLDGNYENWTLHQNSFGQPKFRKNGWTLDILALQDVVHINEENLAATLDNALIGCPINVQAIAFDPDERKIFGDEGIKAILNRKLRINNKRGLERYCKLKGFTTHSYLFNLGRSLGFDIEL